LVLAAQAQLLLVLEEQYQVLVQLLLGLRVLWLQLEPFLLELFLQVGLLRLGLQRLELLLELSRCELLELFQ